MCKACDISAALGQLAAENARSGESSVAGGFALGRRSFVTTALACVSVGIPAAANAAAAQPAKAAPSDGSASTVFRNGAVYTVSSDKPWAEAVAVAGDRIVAVGSDDDMQKFISAGTEVIDLDGQMLMPGFVEGHTHPFLGAFATSGVDLQYPTREEAIGAIKEYVAQNPTGPLRGFGWRMDMFPDSGPTRQELDQIVSDRPIMLFAIDVHSLWVNSKALEIAGVTKDTPDPIPNFSYFARDAKGEPTGFVLEVLALIKVVNAVEPVTVNSMSAVLGTWLPKASAAGITTIFDAAVPPLGNDEGDIIQVYADYEARGQLPFRVVACHAIKGPPVDGAVPTVLKLSQRFRSPLVEARVLKIVADGTEEGWTAYLLEPYTDKPGFRGIPPFTQEQMTKVIRDADAAGVDVHVHACGDATVRMALNAFEEAIANGPARERRNTIAHNVLVDDADIPRFGKLGVIAEFAINWHSMDPDTVDILTARCGPERQSKLYRPRSILKTGGRISAGTDWPAAGYFSTYKPLDSIQIGVTRQLLDRSGDNVCLEPADERLDLSEALAANTIGAAHQLRLDHKVGSIEVGKHADLIVLERNLFKIPASQIAGTAVKMTMLNGSFIYRQPT